MSPKPTLSARALAFRGFHAAIAVVELLSLAYVWGCAITRRRGAHLNAAATMMVAEGAALVVGGGNCPLAPLQRRVGDPTPLFELALGPAAARRAVPLLAAAASVGIGLAAKRVGFRRAP